MRGAERPGKVHWSRPFLLPLEPLDQAAARRTFIDIADGTHEPTEVDKVLSLTDNMPLAITLLAHLVDSEGCSSVLSCWEGEWTSMISDGYDKRSSLDLSISLSLSSPRLDSLPQTKDLLSLLSILPDGLSNADLVQSKLPIDNILGCKATLIHTTLAYNDEHKRLKVLVPVREYMQKISPPGDHLVRPLLKHFQELLEFRAEYTGTLSASATVGRISSNFANIQNVLHNGLREGHSDLKDSIYCTCALNAVSRLMGRGAIPWISQIYHLLPLPRDPQLETCFIAEMFTSRSYYQISDPEIQICHALKQFELFDDSDIKCMLLNKSCLVRLTNFAGKFYLNTATYYQEYKADWRSATRFCQDAISIAISTGNTRRHAQALHSLAWIKWVSGNYSAAQSDAYQFWQLARICGDLHLEAISLQTAAICWYTLGNYRQSISLCNRARNLLGLCGMSDGSSDHDISSSQAEVHKLKSEYFEARNIHTQILHQSTGAQDTYHHALATLNIAEIDMEMGAPKDTVQRHIDMAKSLFINTGHSREIIVCECFRAGLNFREGDMTGANTLFCQGLTVFWGEHSELVIYCLERLADVTQWNGSHGVSTWPTVFLAHSIKSKEKLGIYKALQYLGDLFCTQDDKDTAVTLFKVALAGFTHMDVHRSRAECMLRLGDISKKHGDLLMAVELWERARPLFERSSQGKQIENIDKRLAAVGEDVRELHRENLARLAELNTPIGTVEEVDNDLSNIEEDLEVLNFNNEQLDLTTA